MGNLLKAPQLLELLLRAIGDSGWRGLVLSRDKPFKFRAFKQDRLGFDFSVYIWNCTHGGGLARADHEYRVQITGVVPKVQVGAATLLLGWHADYEVFIAWDIQRHSGQDSSSPSIQVAEETLKAASTRSFAVHTRQNQEIAVAFRPEFLIDYARNSRELHAPGTAHEFSGLNDLKTFTEDQIREVSSIERKSVISQIVRKYRATDFAKRVLGAYGYRCAMCDVDLELIDAAHIIPVAAPTSTDETVNGVALCKLHHAAFDRNLVSFDEHYRIEVSSSELGRLNAAKLAGGMQRFREALRTSIALPSNRADQPPPSYIAEARAVRGWKN